MVYVSQVCPSAGLTNGRLAEFRQKHLGFVFQSYNLLPNLNAIENVAMPLMFRGVPKRKRETIARAMLKRVGLGKRMNHYPTQMSGGQQQRVGIARAFVTRPQVVFADEPTGNLDSKTKTEVMDMICSFARDSTRPSCSSHMTTIWRNTPIASSHFLTAASSATGLRNFMTAYRQL